MEAVLVAVITAVPATIAAAAAWVSARNTKTNHGKRLGQHVEDLVERTERLETGQEVQRLLWAEHTAQDERNFQELRQEIAKRG